MANIFRRLFGRSEGENEVSASKIEEEKNTDDYSDAYGQVEVKVNHPEKTLKELIKEHGRGFQYQSFDKQGNMVTMEVTDVVHHENGGMIVYSRSV